jgi:hypothetical protein
MPIPPSFTVPVLQSSGHAAVQMETYAVGGCGQAANVFSFGGNLYQVLQDLSGFATPVRVNVFKSTDGGATWAKLDSANAPTKSAVPSAGVYFDGAHTITTATTLGDIIVPSSHPITLQDFDLSTGLWGAPYGAGSGNVGGVQQIYKRSDGSLFVIVYNSTNSISAYSFLGGVWTNFSITGSFPGGWSTNLATATAFDPATDIVHMFGIAFEGGINKKHYYQQIDLANTVSQFQDLTGTYIAASAMGNPLILSGNIVWGVSDPTNSYATIIVGTPLAAPVFTVAPSPGIDPGQPIPSASIFTLQPTLATDGTELWAVVCDSSVGQVVRLSVTANIANPVSGWTGAVVYSDSNPDGIQYPTLSIIGGLPFITFQQNPGGGQPTNYFFAGIDPNTLALSCGNPPVGAVGQSYSHTFAATGGTPGYTYAKTAGTFPPGLTLNASTGLLSGILSSSGLFNFTVQATDSLAATANTGSCSISVITQSNGRGGGQGRCGTCSYTLTERSEMAKASGYFGAVN